jgi:hypothetical protein
MPSETGIDGRFSTSERKIEYYQIKVGTRNEGRRKGRKSMPPKFAVVSAWVTHAYSYSHNRSLLFLP